MARPRRPADVWNVLTRLNVPLHAKAFFQAQRDHARRNAGNDHIPDGDRGTILFMRLYLEEHLQGVFVRTAGHRKRLKP